MRTFFQVVLGVALFFGITAVVVYSTFPLFWEYQDQPFVYSITWRSGIVLFLLVIVTQWISRLAFCWIGRLRSRTGG